MGATSASYTTGSVTSTDGTTIGYRRLGTGPGAVLIHGGMMAAQNFMRLGTALGSEFTVYLPDRRGRGLSGPCGPDFTLRRASEDVQALMAQTGARNVFGLSAGAIPVLQWALTCPGEYRVALFEPPLPTNGSSLVEWLPRYEQEMTRGRLAAALVTVAKGTQDSRMMGLLPRTILVPLMGLALRAQARQVGGDDVALEDLVPTMRDDAQLVLDATDLIEASTVVRAEVLLLGGTRSARYLKDALDALQIALPQPRRAELPGLGHLAADNDGRPDVVARVLISFFLNGHASPH